MLLYFALIYFTFPIALGLFLAYILFPIFDFFKRLTKLPFPLIVIFLSLTIFSLVGVIGFLLIQSLLQLLPSVQTTLYSFSLKYIEDPLVPYIIEKLSTILNDITIFLIDTVKNSLNSLFDLFLFTITFYFSLFESKKIDFGFLHIPQKPIEKSGLAILQKRCHLLAILFLWSFSFLHLHSFYLVLGFTFYPLALLL